MTILYLFRVFRLVFLGEVQAKGKEGSKVMVASVVTLAFLSLLAGIVISYPMFFAQTAVASMAGVLTQNLH